MGTCEGQGPRVPERIRWTSLLLVIVACASSTSDGANDSPEGEEDVEAIDQAGFASPGRGESMPSVTYGDSAEENWRRGEEAFADEEFLAAQRYYAYIRSKFPYSRYAPLADLRIADCQFERGRHIEAIDSYQNFSRLHPTHERMPYALFRVGLAYFEQIPGDWFLLPPSHEKDQSAVRDAERALRDFVDRFPKHEDAGDARKVLAEVELRLVAHERYAADFYKRLDKHRAVAGRLELIRARYPEVALDDALLLEIAEVWARVGEKEKAEDALRELEKKFPSSPLLMEAREAVATTSTVARGP